MGWGELDAYGMVVLMVVERIGKERVWDESERKKKVVACAFERRVNTYPILLVESGVAHTEGRTAVAFQGKLHGRGRRLLKPLDIEHLVHLVAELAERHRLGKRQRRKSVEKRVELASTKKKAKLGKLTSVLP